MNNTEIFRWWPLGCVATGIAAAPAGPLEMFTDPLDTSRVTLINVFLRMDMPYFGPGNGTLEIIPEMSVDGTAWSAVPSGQTFGPYAPGTTTTPYAVMPLAVADVGRMMRFKFVFQDDGVNAGIFVATFDLTGIGRSGV